MSEQLRLVPVQDRETWARVAGQTAGAFAAWSQRVEPVAGPLAATADALSRSAQIRRRPVRPVHTRSASLGGAALLLMQAAKQGNGTVAEAVLLRQLASLARALYDMHRAAGETRPAVEVAAAVRGQLAQVAARMPHPEEMAAVGDRVAQDAARVAAQGQVPIGTSGSPVPARLEPVRPHTPAATGADRDVIER